MIADRHYNPVLFRRLQSAVEEQDAKILQDFLSSQSNSAFRCCGYMLGERIMQECSATMFWWLFHTLCLSDSRAFLVTCLKAMEQRLTVGDISIADDEFYSICKEIKDSKEDVRKILSHLLPIIQNPSGIEELMHHLNVNDDEQRVPYLLQADTLSSAYILFGIMRRRDYDKDFLLQICYKLMKRGSTLSFNMASLMKAYFDLTELRGTFSLHLKPWELSRLELSYEAFTSVMQF